MGGSGVWVVWGREDGGEGRGRGGNKEAQDEWARSGGQSTSLSAATPRGRLACPVNQRAVREVPTAWECCLQLSEMCDSPIVAAPMASPPALAMDGGTRLSLWTTEHGGRGGACRGRVGGGVNGVQRGYVLRLLAAAVRALRGVALLWTSRTAEKETWR
jgi:hypothetical protein